MNRIALIISTETSAELYHYALSIAEIILNHEAFFPRKPKIFLTVPGDKDSGNGDKFAEAKALGIQIRPCKWQMITSSDLELVQKITNLNPSLLTETEYCLPDDGANYMLDCDHWILLGDQTPAPLLPIKKYMLAILGYPQRYFENYFTNSQQWKNFSNNGINLARNAKKIITDSQSSKYEISTYAGVTPDNIIVVHPLQKSFPLSSNDTRNVASNRYFIWNIDPSIPFDFQTAMEALEDYYLCKDGKLTTIVLFQEGGKQESSVDSEDEGELSNPDTVQLMSNQINQSGAGHIKIFGCDITSTYNALWSNAEFLWHPGILFGNSLLQQIAYYNLPVITVATPRVVEKGGLLGLELIPCNPKNRLQLSAQLEEMENRITRELSIVKRSTNSPTPPSNFSQFISSLQEG